MIAMTAIKDGVFLSRAANHDIAGDGDESGIGPRIGSRRDVNRGARGAIDGRLDGGIGVAGHLAGRRRLGSWEKDQAED
jgi:hypothetical protein